MALVSLDGVAPSRVVGVSVSVNLPCTMKSRSSLLAPAHPSGPGKMAIKRFVWWWLFIYLYTKHRIGQNVLVRFGV